jgi:hypothetical protein
MTLSSGEPTGRRRCRMHVRMLGPAIGEAGGPTAGESGAHCPVGSRERPAAGRRAWRGGCRSVRSGQGPRSACSVPPGRAARRIGLAVLIARRAANCDAECRHGSGTLSYEHARRSGRPPAFPLPVGAAPIVPWQRASPVHLDPSLTPTPSARRRGFFLPAVARWCAAANAPRGYNGWAPWIAKPAMSRTPGCGPQNSCQ